MPWYAWLIAGMASGALLVWLFFLWLFRDFRFGPFK